MSTNKFKIALIQMKVTEDKSLNLKNAEKLINESIEKENPEIIVLPEFFNSPYGISFMPIYAEEVNDSETLNFISSLAKKTQKFIVAGSIPIKELKSDLNANDPKYTYFNACFIFNRKGEIVARHNKVHLFDIDIPGKITFKESEVLTSGNSFTSFETEFCNVGIGICYDIRFPEYSMLLKKEKKVDLLIFPAAFNTVTGPMHWDLLIRSRALDNNIHVAVCSPARNIDNPNGYQAYGFSCVYDPFAKCLGTASFEEEIVFCEIDLQRNRDIEQQIPTWKQKRNDMYNITSN